MIVSKFFARVTDKIIKGALRNDIFEYVFRIKTLSVMTLRKYAAQITNSTQCAHLMLAAGVSGNTVFISELIPLIIKNIEPENSSSKFLENLYCQENIFFNYIPKDTVGYKFIDFNYYFKIWLITLLRTKQLNVLDQMYSYRVNRCHIFDILTVSLEYPSVKIINDYIKKMIYDNDEDISYYIHHVINELSFTRNKINQYLMYALYGVI